MQDGDYAEHSAKHTDIHVGEKTPVHNNTHIRTLPTK